MNQWLSESILDSEYKNQLLCHNFRLVVSLACQPVRISFLWIWLLRPASQQNRQRTGYLSPKSDWIREDRIDKICRMKLAAVMKGWLAFEPTRHDTSA